jgi:hypothetical protein
MTSGRTVQTVDERALFFIRLSTGYACPRALNA